MRALVDANKAVQRLIDLGKLSLDGEGFLRNGRADTEIENRRAWQAKDPERVRQTPGVSKVRNANGPAQKNNKNKECRETRARYRIARLYF